MVANGFCNFSTSLYLLVSSPPTSLNYHQYELMNFYFFKWFVTYCILLLRSSQDWSVGVPSGWLLCPCDMSVPFWALYFWRSKMYQAGCLLFLPSLPFLVPFNGKWYSETKMSLNDLLIVVKGLILGSVYLVLCSDFQFLVMCPLEQSVFLLYFLLSGTS